MVHGYGGITVKIIDIMVQRLPMEIGGFMVSRYDKMHRYYGPFDSYGYWAIHHTLINKESWAMK